LWVGLAVVSALAFVWERWVEEAWYDWRLRVRQRERSRGRSFTVAENVDDFFDVLMHR